MTSLKKPSRHERYKANISAKKEKPIIDISDSKNRSLVKGI
jgi:hypothetical protein